MMNCWAATPDNRPSFKELYKDISRYTECIAGYLELEYNPSGGVEGAEVTIKESEPKNEADKIQSAVSIQVHPPPVGL